MTSLMLHPTNHHLVTLTTDLDLRHPEHADIEKAISQKASDVVQQIVKVEAHYTGKNTHTHKTRQVSYQCAHGHKFSHKCSSARTFHMLLFIVVDTLLCHMVSMCVD